MNLAEKLEVARALADLGVDVIEAGFPIASPGDFEAVQAIARQVHGPTICGLARCNNADLSQFEKNRSNANAQQEYDRLAGVGRGKYAAFPKPIIARIRGFCLGGGLAIAMQADLRIAAVDSEFGIPAAKLSIAYAPDSVKRLIDWGANACKILLYYSPFDDPKVNDIKNAFIERIGAECMYYEIPFFLEFVGYDPEGKKPEKGFEFAKIKPQVVMGAIKEYTQDKYNVDVLKVEVPVNMDYVEGTRSYKGTTVYTKADAMRMFRESASASKKPFIDWGEARSRKL
jgi:hypothetical protein